MPLVLGFAGLLGMVLLLTSAITGASFAEVLAGKAGDLYRQHEADPNSASSSSATATPTATAAPVTQTTLPASAARYSPANLFELFWQGAGGIDVKNGSKVAQGFVEGHDDHVHIASSPAIVYAIGKIAQTVFGLHVSENSHFGGVTPGAHVAGSYHYKDEAIDVSGPPAKMQAFAHYTAALFGIH